MIWGIGRIVGARGGGFRVPFSHIFFSLLLCSSIFVYLGFDTRKKKIFKIFFFAIKRIFFFFFRPHYCFPPTANNKNFACNKPSRVRGGVYWLFQSMGGGLKKNRFSKSTCVF